MLRVSKSCRAFVSRGNFAMGSPGQKHMMFAPVQFYYRYPGNPDRPGPVMARYWWTLGMMPSGLDRPFRYHEFCKNYKAMHLPQEIEEWLDFCLVQPSAALAPHALECSKRLLALPAPTSATSVHKRVDITGIARAAEPVQLMGRELGIEIPTFALRAVAERPVLRQRVAVTLAEYSEQVTANGSSPHRRWAAGPTTEPYDSIPAGSSPPLAIEAPVVDGQSSTPHSTLDTTTSVTSTTSEEEVDAHPVHSLPTQPDEKSLIHILTTLAAASSRHGRADTAADLLHSALTFAHDDDTAGDVHANLSSAYSRDGKFTEAVTHGKAAALRSKSPKGWANWAVATAYLDDFDEAARIVERGIEESLEASASGDATEVPEVLQKTAAAIAKGMVGRTAVPEKARGKRFHRPAQTRRGIDTMPGQLFMNETDMIIRPGGGTVRECLRVQHDGTRQWLASAAKVPGLPMDNHNGFSTR